MDIFEYLLGIAMSLISVIYYAIYDVTYGLYMCFYDIVQPLLLSFCDAVQIVVDPVLMTSVVLGIFPGEVVLLVVALCTCKISILFVRLILRIVGSLPTLDGGWFEFR